MKKSIEGNRTYDKGVVERGKGIRENTKIRELLKEWIKLHNQHPLSRTSVRVFEGDIYSLMEDFDFYEDAGCRHLVNILTCNWDGIRDLALIEETEGRIEPCWGDRNIRLTPEEDIKLRTLLNEYEKWMKRLAERFDIGSWYQSLKSSDLEEEN